MASRKASPLAVVLNSLRHCELIRQRGTRVSKLNTANNTNQGFLGERSNVLESEKLGEVSVLCNY